MEDFIPSYLSEGINLSNPKLHVFGLRNMSTSWIFCETLRCLWRVLVLCNKVQPPSSVNQKILSQPLKLLVPQQIRQKVFHAQPTCNVYPHLPQWHLDQVNEKYVASPNLSIMSPIPVLDVVSQTIEDLIFYSQWLAQFYRCFLMLLLSGLPIHL